MPMKIASEYHTYDSAKNPGKAEILQVWKEVIRPERDDPEQFEISRSDFHPKWKVQRRQ